MTDVTRMIFLTLSIWFSVVNFGLIAHKQNVPAFNLLLQGGAIALFCNAMGWI